MNLAAGCGTGLRGGADMKLIESFSTTSLQLARIFVAWAPRPVVARPRARARAASGCGFAALGSVQFLLTAFRVAPPELCRGRSTPPPCLTDFSDRRDFADSAK